MFNLHWNSDLNFLMNQCRNFNEKIHNLVPDWYLDKFHIMGTVYDLVYLFVKQRQSA